MDYLHTTTPDLWSLDSFGEWCMANYNRFARDKAKILDSMQKDLEAVSNDVHLPGETRSKANELIQNLQASCLPLYFLSRGQMLNWDRVVPNVSWYNFEEVSQGCWPVHLLWPTAAHLGDS